MKKMTKTAYLRAINSIRDSRRVGVIEEPDMVWLQTQAPAGNWCDNLGLPFKRGDQDSYEDAVARAHEHGLYLTTERKTETAHRVVCRITEVLC